MRKKDYRFERILSKSDLPFICYWFLTIYNVSIHNFMVHGIIDPLTWSDLLLLSSISLTVCPFRRDFFTTDFTLDWVPIRQLIHSHSFHDRRFRPLLSFVFPRLPPPTFNFVRSLTLFYLYRSRMSLSSFFSSSITPISPYVYSLVCPGTFITVPKFKVEVLLPLSTFSKFVFFIVRKVFD